MASLSQERHKGREKGWRITWYEPDGKQKALRLGKVAQRSAERMLVLVERLQEAKRLGLPLDGETTRWITSLCPKMAERFAQVGLISPRQTATLRSVLDTWIGGLRCKDFTKASYEVTTREVCRYFGEDRPIKTITVEEAEKFVRYLEGEGLNRPPLPSSYAISVRHSGMPYVGVS